MKQLAAIVCLMLALASAGAQDLHFSQVDADPLLLNPAYAGFFNGTGRFGVIYRNQWASVSIPYETFAFTGEWALHHSDTKQQGLSMGLSLFSDHAGTLNYGTTSAHLSAAYFTALDRNGSNNLSVGLDLGYAISGFDPSQAEMTDPQESFDVNQTQYPLLGLGLAWYYQPTSIFHTKVGISVRNINRPNISYLQASDIYLERRYSLFARAEYRCWQSASVLPVLMMQHQGVYNEILYGADLKWYLSESSAHEVSLRGGFSIRHRDALIANFIMEYDALIMSFCYDANISQLSAASRYIGAFEIGLVYRVPQLTKKIKALKCPQY